MYFKAKEWVNLFISLGAKATGYKKANVTPYMHGMVYHVPFFMSQHSGLSKFTGQGKRKPSYTITIYLLYRMIAVLGEITEFMFFCNKN
jgi:hypothetical protein